MAEQRVSDLEGKLGESKIRLVQAESVISAQDREVANLKEAVAESEDKFYDMGFADAENSSKPIMRESRRYRFGEGWMAAVNALGLPEEFAFKDPKQVPYPEELLRPPVQTTT